MTGKQVIGKIHLWLGLASGLVVLVVSLTGSIYAFQYEIQEWVQSYRHVGPRTEAFLPPSQFRSIAEQRLPGKKIHSVIYDGPERAAVVVFYDFDPLYYYQVYANPYTGDVLKVKDMSRDFFYQVLQGHYYLWLPPEIGQPAVATSTLVFVVMLISGLILWWPKKGKSKQRFTIKWNARWRRKNYDLHNVPGFYGLSIALILGLTGLVWGFQWFGDAVHKLAGGEKTLVYETPHVSKGESAYEQPIDKLWADLSETYASADFLEVHFPEDDSAAITVTINPDRTTYWKADYRYYHPHTLDEIEVDNIYGKMENASAADKLIRMNYDIHTGGILGFPGKLLAFCAGLLCASLPITGFVIWYGRKYKRRSSTEETEAPYPATEEALQSVETR